jgi:hypothetical protein
MLELPPPDAITALDATELPAVLIQLAALQSAVGARLAAVQPPVPPAADGDGLLTAKQAAELLGLSESWMRKRGSTLPGFCQPTGRGGRARWSRAALLEWRDSCQLSYAPRVSHLRLTGRIPR